VYEVTVGQESVRGLRFRPLYPTTNVTFMCLPSGDSTIGLLVVSVPWSSVSPHHENTGNKITPRRIEASVTDVNYVILKLCVHNLITFHQDAAVFSLLHFCRQLYMFRVLTSIIRSWYVTNEYPPYDTHESVPTQQRERMVVDPVNQYQKL